MQYKLAYFIELNIGKTVGRLSVSNSVRLRFYVETEEEFSAIMSYVKAFPFTVANFSFQTQVIPPETGSHEQES